MPEAELHTWFTWSEMIGAPPLTRPQFQQALRNFPRSALLIGCSRLSSLFKYGPEGEAVASKEDTLRLIPVLFPPDYVAPLRAAVAQGRVLFFQGQIRCLAAEVLRMNSPHDEDGTLLPDVTWGVLLLGAGELLYKRHVQVTEDLDAMANLVADFLPIYEIDPMTEPVMLYLRFYIFLSIIIPRLPAHLRTFDIPVLFENEFGFSLKLYYQIIFCLINHALLERHQTSIKSPLDGAIRLDWFRSTNLVPDQIVKVFDTICCSLSDLPDKKVVHGYADFEFLRDHPFFRHNDELYALDYEFTAAKLESGVLWRTAKSFTDANRRKAYFSFWGDVFEEYVVWCFETYADKQHNRVYRLPRKGSQGMPPICDLIIRCGSTAILLEAKLATCAANIRYSGDHTKFKKFLEERLVSGTDRQVGVSQLVKAIETIVIQPTESHPALQGIKKIIPLIVTKDEIGSSWVINAYLNARFQQKRNRKKCKKYRVTPLVCMNASTLERSIASLSEMAFSDILEDRMRGDKSLNRPFEAASSYVHRGPARKVLKHLSILENLAAEITSDLGLTGNN